MGMLQLVPDAYEWKGNARQDGVTASFRRDSGMPLPRHVMKELEHRHERDTRDANADRRRDLLLTAVRCMISALAGLALVGLSFHLTDGTYARLAYFGGIALGNGGIILSLASAYKRGEARGDW
jgi:hypothetical protein